MKRSEKWKWGMVAKDLPKLEPLLRALERLKDKGLMAAGVVAAFHGRRVLPQA
jgi:hypothetical protein